MARSDVSRGMRDEANVGPDPRRAHELRRLSDLGKWQVADGEPDIRGWPVYSSTGREFGIVDDLLVDTDAGEVVMLDVDLKRNDRHTLAPLRAAWIDRGTKRVVLDARELASDAGREHELPALPRQGALSDDEMRRFNDDYVHAYGGRGAERDREYRLRRGDEEIHFGLQPRADLPASGRPATDDDAPRRLLDADERPHGDPLRPSIAGGAAGMTGGQVGDSRHGADARTDVRDSHDRHTLGGPHSDESQRINAELEDLPRDRAPGAIADDHGGDRRGFDRARDDRDAGLDAIPDTAAIEPRELDGRVRIDEGATVDDRTPVGGVRYDSPNFPRHDYELGSEYDRERVVSRRPGERSTADRAHDDAEDAARRLRETEERRVRYRTWDDRGRPGDERR